MRETQASDAVASPPPVWRATKRGPHEVSPGACFVCVLRPGRRPSSRAPGSLLGLAVQGQRPRLRRGLRRPERHQGSGGYIGCRHLAAARPRREAAHGLLLLSSGLGGLHLAGPPGDPGQRRRHAQPLLAHPAGRLLCTLLRPRPHRASAAVRSRRTPVRLVAHAADHGRSDQRHGQHPDRAGRRRRRRRRRQRHLPRPAAFHPGADVPRRIRLLPGRREHPPHPLQQRRSLAIWLGRDRDHHDDAAGTRALAQDVRRRAGRHAVRDQRRLAERRLPVEPPGPRLDLSRSSPTGARAWSPRASATPSP